VSLRGGVDPVLPPVFLIASAGGTLGAYAKLAKALQTPREIIGVRDPYIWGGREATCGFRAWIDVYLAAIRQRQRRGPYHVVAYSSAGAFGYEIARRLRQEGEEVALLALIDPLGMDRPSPKTFGFRAMNSRFDRPYRRWAIRLEGWWRARAAASVAAAEAGPVEIPVSAAQFGERVLRARRNRSSVRAFAALMQLNSGMPFGISESELSALPPERYFPAFLDRVRNAAPELDTGAVERIFDQYEGLQVPAQQAYPLHRYEGRVLLVEPEGSGCGLIKLQLRPHVPHLEFRAIRVGPPDARVAAIAGSLSHQLRGHYLCMRDDRFVASLAVELDRALT
jgi:thioesterase domain-containing protein